MCKGGECFITWTQTWCEEGCRLWVRGGGGSRRCGCFIQALSYLMMLVQILRGLWLFSMSSLPSDRTYLCFSPPVNLWLWEHTIPRSQRSLSPPQLLKASFPPYLSISETGLYFKWHMQIATSLFTNIKAKACFFHRCVNWVEWKASANIRQDYLLFSFNLQGPWACQSRRLTPQQGITISKASYLSHHPWSLWGLEFMRMFSGWGWSLFIIRLEA